VQAEQQAKLEQQRAEQAMLEKIQLEQKMKLLEQQVLFVFFLPEQSTTSFDLTLSRP